MRRAEERRGEATKRREIIRSDPIRKGFDMEKLILSEHLIGCDVFLRMPPPLSLLILQPKFQPSISIEIVHFHSFSLVSTIAIAIATATAAAATIATTAAVVVVAAHAATAHSLQHPNQFSVSTSPDHTAHSTQHTTS